MNRKQYPLHPGQTHVEPMYTQVPTEDYEALKREVQQLREITKGSRTTVDDIAEIKTLTSEVNALRKMNAKAQEEIAELREATRWRKCSEELPEEIQPVMFLAKYKRACVRLWVGEFRCLDGMKKEDGLFYTSCPGWGCEFLESEVIGWMPQMKAPEEK